MEQGTCGSNPGLVAISILEIGYLDISPASKLPYDWNIVKAA